MARAPVSSATRWRTYWCAPDKERGQPLDTAVGNSSSLSSPVDDDAALSIAPLVVGEASAAAPFASEALAAPLRARIGSCGVDVRGLSKMYGGVVAVRPLNLQMAPGQVTGEATPDYLDDPLFSARRIRRQLPNIRLLVLLRDPIERAHAAWYLCGPPPVLRLPSGSQR